MSFQPDGYYAWDLWFAHDGEKQHIYYLQASKEACGHDLHKRHNLSGVGHAVLKDANFVEVSREPVFSASTADNAWDNLSIWTGSIIKDPDSSKYLMFYTARRREDEPIWTPSEYQRPQNIGLAFSEDLIHWKRHPLSIDKPVIANPGKDNEIGFDGVAWRDPYLIKIGDWYYCLLAARLVPNQVHNIDDWDQGGAVVWLRSKDLYDWTDATPEVLVASRHFYEMEVPQLIPRIKNGELRYLLLFCCQRKGCSKERMKELPDAENLNGTYMMISDALPPDSTELPGFSQPAKLVAPSLYAGKVIDPSAEELLLYGFDIGLAEESACDGITSSRLPNAKL